jgi:FkbM family methyltransferase
MNYIPFNFAEFNRWVSDNGDNTLRLSYPLNRSSIVVDAGGYMGNWTNDISRKYDCFVYVLEPLKMYHNHIIDKFKNNNKIIPLNIALSNKTEETTMSIEQDGSSIFANVEGKMESIQCIDIKDFFTSNNIECIDLIKINIEGSEYDLLERIIELNLHKKIKNLQIQFHVFIENCDLRRQAIRNALSETHECTWNYEFIWENWKIK